MTGEGELSWGGDSGWKDEIVDSEGVSIENGRVKPSSVPTSGLIAHWELDGDATDSAGTHHGTASGGVSFVTDAERGQVAEFDGVDGLVHAEESSLDGASQATVSGWMKSTHTGNWNAPFAYEGDSDVNYGFILRYHLHDDAVEVLLNGTADSLQWSNYDTYDGNWHLMTLVWDAGTLTLYRDGEVVASGTTSSSALSLDGEFNVGRYRWDHADDNWWYDGAVDDVRIYDRALTSEEVQGLYDGTK